MLIVPAEADLQSLVESGHRTVATHEKPSPNQRADAAQYRSQPVDLCVRTISFHNGRSRLLCTAHPKNEMLSNLVTEYIPEVAKEGGFQA